MSIEVQCYWVWWMAHDPCLPSVFSRVLARIVHLPIASNQSAVVSIFLWQTNVWLHDQGYVSENIQVFVDVLNNRAYQGLLNSYRECCFCYYCLFFLFTSSTTYQSYIPECKVIVESKMKDNRRPWKVAAVNEGTTKKLETCRVETWIQSRNIIRKPTRKVTQSAASASAVAFEKKFPIILDPQGPMPWGGGKEAGSIDLNGKSLKKGRSPVSDDGFFAVANKAQQTGNQKKTSKGWSGTRCEWCQKHAWCTVNYNCAIYEDQQGNA